MPPMEYDHSCLERAESYALSIPLYYTLICLVIIMVCSVVYFLKLKHDKIIYVKQGSIKSNIIEYLKTMYKFRSVYGALLTSLFDQVSDISVMNQLYLLSKDEQNGIIECHSMNATYLFYGSVFFFSFYRIVSSIAIFVYSRHSYFLTFLQFFDLIFIKTLQINYKFQKTNPCSAQRYILNLEAMFEAFPQFILQSYFLISINMITNANTTGKRNIIANYVIIISICFSLYSIISKKMSQDKYLVKPQWQNLNFRWKNLGSAIKDCNFGCNNDESSVVSYLFCVVWLLFVNWDTICFV